MQTLINGVVNRTYLPNQPCNTLHVGPQYWPLSLISILWWNRLKVQVIANCRDFFSGQQNQGFLNPKSFFSMWQSLAGGCSTGCHGYHPHSMLNLLEGRVWEQMFQHAAINKVITKWSDTNRWAVKAIGAFGWQYGYPAWQGASELHHLTFNFSYITFTIFIET